MFPGLPRDFEGAEKSDTSEHGEAKRRHHFVEGQDHFQKTAQDNKEIKTVEQGNKITLKVYKLGLELLKQRGFINLLPEIPEHTF